MLLRPVAVLANMLNPRCRGILLKEEERASALKVLGSFSEELGIPAPSVDEVLEFTQCRGAFVGVGDLQCTCFNLWSAVFPTTSLSPLAKLLSTLPCSQASVERVFSAADWAVDNRERLGFDKLALEVSLYDSTTFVWWKRVGKEAVVEVWEGRGQPAVQTVRLPVSDFPE